ncbi:glutathione S-transferase family protein [Sorangium sp. So ce1000]|uniref:glutathione S-transferase family protein n=1 Tax=Sorangium sp. So ce1000 TaxID=3133325 RepID=UPI003F5F3DCD
MSNSRSLRVVWLLEELGVDYELKRYQRDPETMLAPPELRAVHPLGRSPIVVDGDLTLAESGAILEYLVDRYGQGRFAPQAGSPERLRYTYWMHYAEGTAMPPMLLKLLVDRMENAPMPFAVRPLVGIVAERMREAYVTPQVATQLSFMEAELRKTSWFAGQEFTAADVQMSVPVESARARCGLTAATHPRLAAWLERVHARPAYRRAIEKGGAPSGPPWFDSAT